MLAISSHSARVRGSGVPLMSVAGIRTARATDMRNTANATGGTSRTPSLMNSHTVLQMAHVSSQTNNVNGAKRSNCSVS